MSKLTPADLDKLEAWQRTGSAPDNFEVRLSELLRLARLGLATEEQQPHFAAFIEDIATPVKPQDPTALADAEKRMMDALAKLPKQQS